MTLYGSIWGHSVHLSPNDLYFNHRRAKRREIRDLWILVTYIWGTYDFVVFKVISGHFWSFGALVSKWPVLGKGLFIERKGMTFEIQEH